MYSLKQIKWNDEWRTELKEQHEDMWIRLCECKNKRDDIPIMAGLMYHYNSDRTKEECLDRTLEWVCDWNNQWDIDFSEDEYNMALEKISKGGK